MAVARDANDTTPSRTVITDDSCLTARYTDASQELSLRRDTHQASHNSGELRCIASRSVASLNWRYTWVTDTS